MLATVSHELRNPLASIQGYAATLLRHEHRISPEERHEFLLAINEASSRLAGVIDALLEMSELETRTFELERTPVNSARLVREAVTVPEQRRDTAKEKEAHQGIPFLSRHPTFVVHLENCHGRPTEDELLIEADPRRLREVLDHLFKNAVTYSSEDGIITVSIRPLFSSDDLKMFPVSSSEIARQLIVAQQCHQQLVVIRVQDRGRGIATKHLPHLFDPFYRVDTRLTRETNGLGIGLAICWRIVALHDGLLWMESEVGRGSTFYVCLPVKGNLHDERREKHAEIACGEKKGKRTMPVKKTTILTADDDPQLLRLVTRNLEFEDYAVLTASDGQQALDVIEQQTPDAVLLDVMMPKMDGFTVCQRVREFSAVPIILVTARGQDQDKVRGLDLGADDYLTKPFNVDELLARVRAVLRRAQFAVNEPDHVMRTLTTVGELTIDSAQHLVRIQGREVSMTPIEYRLLSYLAQNAGRVLTQDLLLEHVWGTDYLGESHMLQVNINRLRRKLESDPTHPHYILTKVGIGYFLNTQPEVQVAR